MTDRNTGIESIGSAHWGTHFCGFYGTREDLAATLIPYFATGLQEDEFCQWITSDPLTVEDATKELRRAIPDLDRYFDRKQIEIWDYRDWYLRGGHFDSDRVLGQWAQKEKEALDRGYQGCRIAGNTTWIDKKDWPDFVAYETEVNRSFPSLRMIGLCTYCMEGLGADAALEVICSHQLALARISGRSEKIDGSILVIATEELRRLNERLHETIKERTAHLETANTELDARLRTQTSLAEQLQQLCARLLDLQDEERRRIATQLHEVVAQNLFGLSVNLDRLQQRPRMSNLESILAECQMLCEQSLKQIRTLSYLLHPPMLDLAGLASALQAYIAGVARQSDIHIEFQATSDLGRLSPDVETDLFRVVQEGLSNVVRHSGSLSAIVRLEKPTDFVVLQIEDFGRGMPASVIDALSAGRGEIGVGLLGVRERLRQIGGRLEIQSSHKGTILTASVPLPL
jgi:signal transduction histidine kinase